MALLTSDKIDFKMNITKRRIFHNKVVYQKDNSNPKCVPTNSFTIHEVKIDRVKGEIDKFAIIDGDFNASYLVID